jgi:chromosome segregation ATPase
MKSSSLKDIFQSVGALGNDITRGVIPVNLDKDGGFVENIMVYEAPELIPDGEGNLKFTKARKKPVFELIQGYLNQVGEARSDLAEAEATIKELQDTIDELKSDNNLLEETSETSRAELSATKQKVVGIDKTMGELQRSLINFQSLSAINQDRINMTDKQLEEMREKAERKGTKLSDEKALETILDIRSTISNEMPDIQQQGGQTQGNVTTPSK